MIGFNEGIAHEMKQLYKTSVLPIQGTGAYES